MTRGMGSQWCLSSTDPCAKQHLSLSEHVPNSKCLHRDVLYFLLSIQIMLDEHVSRALRQQVFLASAPIHLKINKLQAATSRLDRLIATLNSPPPLLPAVEKQQLVRWLPLVDQGTQREPLRHQWQNLKTSMVKLVDKLSGLEKRLQNTQLRIVELVATVNSHRPAEYTLLLPQSRPHPPPLLHSQLSRINLHETLLTSIEQRTQRLQSVLSELTKTQNMLGRLKSEENLLTFRSAQPKSTRRSPTHPTTDRPTVSTTRQRIQRRKIELKGALFSGSQSVALMADI